MMDFGTTRQFLTRIHWDNEIEPGGELQLSKRMEYESKLIGILTDKETADAFQVLKLDVGMYNYMESETIPLRLIANTVAKAYVFGPAPRTSDITFMLQNISKENRIFEAVLVLEYKKTIRYGQIPRGEDPL